MTTTDLTIATAATRMILEEEGLSHADWPGAASGVTIGRGYDLGYHKPEELLADWGGRLPLEVIDRLRPACGVTGDRARELAKTMKGIRIPVDVADAVFLGVDMPRWIQRAAATFEGYDALPDEIQGALVSLVFNRGTRMRSTSSANDERREMRVIRAAVMRWATQGKPSRDESFPRLRASIAEQLRSMKRLWVGKNLGGLLRRRESEALLVETAVLK